MTPGAGPALTVSPDTLRDRAAESCSAGFPADLAGPFAEANAYFTRVDAALTTGVAEAADLVRGAAEGYAAADESNAARLRAAAGPLSETRLRSI